MPQRLGQPRFASQCASQCLSMPLNLPMALNGIAASIDITLPATTNLAEACIDGDASAPCGHGLRCQILIAAVTGQRAFDQEHRCPLVQVAPGGQVVYPGPN